MPEAGKKIMIVAGEASGDLHGGHLALELKKLLPEARLFGIGGDNMRAAGVETVVDISSLAVVGIVEVIAHFREIKSAFDRARRAIKDDSPDVIVLIDYPDFNLRLAKVAGEAGVPVVYYVSPQVWAWRRGRIKKIASLVRKMLVLFPFEEEIYRDAGVDCIFVGHPLMDERCEPVDRDAFFRSHEIGPGSKVLGLLPGSRRKEVAFNLPSMLAAYRLLKKEMPDLAAVIPVAPTLGIEDFSPYLLGYNDVKLIKEGASGVLDVMDAAVVVSGTATLQAALHGKPMVIVYRLSPLTYILGRALIKVSHIGLVNLVWGGSAVPELIQDDASPDKIAGIIRKIFSDPEYCSEMVARLAEVRVKLGGPGASARAER